MKTSEFLSYLKNLGIHLLLDGEKLLFKAPKGALTPALKQELAARKPELIELLQTLQGSQSGPLSIQPAARDQPLPLSFSQQRLWFLAQMEPESVAYNVPMTYRLAGALHIPALEASLQALIQRHESLRTTFREEQGQPYQVIWPQLQFRLPVTDLRWLDAPQRHQEAQRIVHQVSHRVFDLTQAPLFAAHLIQLNDHEYWLSLNLHHIIFDGWSLGVFCQELSALYGAWHQGQPSPLAELPIQYADFALWQRQWLQGELLSGQLDYWKRTLQGVAPLLELPTDRPRPPRQTYRGASYRFTLPPQMLHALKHLSQQEGATLFMTLLAAFKVLLYRYSGQEDIVVGSPIANRNHANLEQLIGFFVNTLVFRTQLSSQATFRQLLAQVRSTALDVYAHQDIPFEMLYADALQLERSLSYSPLFQVMFVLQNTESSGLQLPDAEITVVSRDSDVAKFDLTLSMRESAAGLGGWLEYNIDLFDASTIDQMMGHFQTLLAGIVRDLDQPISTLPLLSDRQQQRLLGEWNRPHPELIDRLCIHQRFEQQVERRPDAVAVVGGDRHLTYQELNLRANHLAHELQSLGVGPETLVGLCMNRSLDMVVGLLAILKAGGAYVPLDPNYPSDRLAFMVRDAQVSVLLSQSHLAPLVTQLQVEGVPVLWVDGDRPTESASAANPSSRVTPDHLAYVIYTSGSTGQPKGVMITHRSLAHFVQAATTEYQMTAADRVLQFASISFDAAVEEIYPCLTAGGTLVLRTDEMISTAAQFLATCRDWQVTVLDFPTAYWHQLVTEIAAKGLLIPDSVRLVLIGGERALPETVQLWQQHIGASPQLVNTYGPTEATVVATTCWLDTRTPEAQRGDFPIGRPLGHTQAYIVDQTLQLVPIGVPGELLIGGAGLARGYWQRPELTAEKFIANPFSPGTDDRLYRTGDRVRYRQDGSLEFLGRIDDQVKVRGFRIELGEIEALLSQHPEVTAAAVIADDTLPGDTRLVAYVVPSSDPEHTPDPVGIPVGIADEPVQQMVAAVRQFLRSQLPDYMLPSAFVPLATLPLTPSGKVDRRALPRPDAAHLARSTAFVAPRHPIEAQIAQIWTDVLHRDPVGIHDNFFELGGHSLLATQVLSRVRDELQVELTLHQLFERPTLADLAHHCLALSSAQNVMAEILPEEEEFEEEDL
jgi:amino acid adenylation domain-containing protein